MRHSNAAFVEEIRQHPRDITPRLVYADYLEEQGDVRGELIRVQCFLSELPTGHEQRPALLERERALLGKHGETWLAPLRTLGVTGVSQASFQRGLLENATIPARAFLEHAEALCEREPALRRVALTEVAGHALELAAMRLPAQITAVDLSSNRLNEEEGGRGLPPLCRAVWSKQVEELDLSFNLPTSALSTGGQLVLRALCNTLWPRLGRLGLAGLGIEAAGVQELASGIAAELVELELSSNPIGGAGLGPLDRVVWSRLERLNISRCGLTTLAALSQESMPRLKTLLARGNQFSNEELQRFRAAPLGQSLTTFDVRNNTPGTRR